MISFEASWRFKQRVKALRLDRAEVYGIMHLTAAIWGQPHLHTGRGIRTLAPGVFETRMGRDLRLVFEPMGNVLTFDFIGNHDEVRAYTRNRR